MAAHRGYDDIGPFSHLNQPVSFEQARAFLRSFGGAAQDMSNRVTRSLDDLHDKGRADEPSHFRRFLAHRPLRFIRRGRRQMVGRFDTRWFVAKAWI